MKEQLFDSFKKKIKESRKREKQCATATDKYQALLCGVCTLSGYPCVRLGVTLAG